MAPSSGFPDNSRFTAVPNLLFGPLLEEIDDLAIFKLILRLLWLHSRKKGFPRYLTWEELSADRTLANILSVGGRQFSDGLQEALLKAQELGVVIHKTVRAKDGGGVVEIFMPNSQEGRRAAARLVDQEIEKPASWGVVEAVAPFKGNSSENIFSLYEDNIGIIGHIIAEELKEAERDYPFSWIKEAFREAAVQNKRNWRYVEAILKGWMAEGREDGEPGRHSKKVDSREWIRRYGLPKAPR